MGIFDTMNIIGLNKKIGRLIVPGIVLLLLSFVHMRPVFALSDNNYLKYVAQQVYENCKNATLDSQDLTLEYVIERLREFDNSPGSGAIHVNGSPIVYMQCKDYVLSYLNGDYYGNGTKITAPLIYQNAENINNSAVNQTAIIGTDGNSFWKNILSNSIVQIIGGITLIILGFFLRKWLTKRFSKTN